MSLSTSQLLLLGAGGAACILLILVIVLFVMLNKQNKRLQELEERLGKFTRGSQAKSLEGEMAQMFDEHDALMKLQKKNQRDIQEIYARERSMIQKVGVVKYDAFTQMGGSLSSAIAMLDENDNGFIMNTVQSVDGCYSYVKEVRNGKPDMDIGREEEEALDKAINGRKLGESFGTRNNDKTVPDQQQNNGQRNNPTHRTERRPVRRSNGNPGNS